MWPFTRRSRSGDATSPVPPRPAPGAALATADLSPVLGSPRPTIAPTRFEAELVTRRVTRLVTAPAHTVAPDGPAGVVRGLVTTVAQPGHRAVSPRADAADPAASDVTTTRRWPEPPRVATPDPRAVPAARPSNSPTAPVTRSTFEPPAVPRPVPVTTPPRPPSPAAGRPVPSHPPHGDTPDPGRSAPRPGEAPLAGRQPERGSSAGRDVTTLGRRRGPLGIGPPLTTTAADGSTSRAPAAGGPSPSTTDRGHGPGRGTESGDPRSGGARDDPPPGAGTAHATTVHPTGASRAAGAPPEEIGVPVLARRPLERSGVSEELSVLTVAPTNEGTREPSSAIPTGSAEPVPARSSAGGIRAPAGDLLGDDPDGGGSSAVAIRARTAATGGSAVDRRPQPEPPPVWTVTPGAGEGRVDRPGPLPPPPPPVRSGSPPEAGVPVLRDATEQSDADDALRDLDIGSHGGRATPDGRATDPAVRSAESDAVGDTRDADLDRLARDLYGRLRTRLTADLRQERERAGRLSDLPY